MHQNREETMSLSVVHSRALLGLDARAVRVEVHLANGLPSFTLVGLVDVEVREARERVRSALAKRRARLSQQPAHHGQPRPSRFAQGFRTL
jgi:hypothetical protein